MRFLAAPLALAPLLAALSCVAPEPGVCSGVPAAAGSAAGDAGLIDTGTCPSCTDLVTCGSVQNAAVKSASGIAASAKHERVFYLHDGQLTPARFYAIDDTGADRGSFTLAGASNQDWEDIAVGPCPAGSCVFIADTGDEREARAGYTIYRVPEPATLGLGEQTLSADALSFRYPDGSHDAEALLVHPETGVISVITRDRSGAGIVGIYDVPVLPDGSTSTAVLRKQILTSASPALRAPVTGGAIHARSGILLRTTAGIVRFTLGAGQSVADAIEGSVPCTMSSFEETDGNAVTWLRSGSGYLTVDRGPSPELHYTLCGAP
jgi:hypothetical protein